MKNYAGLSFWFDTLPEPVDARQPLDRDLDVDVAIVGGGYTALWSAHYLRNTDPSLSVAILEREVCGFGASGRNGGWCSGKLAASWPRIAKASGNDATTRLRRAMEATVDEVATVATKEGIDCDFAKGGTIDLARNEVQLARARSEVGAARAVGVGEEDLALLGEKDARAILDATERPRRDVHAALRFVASGTPRGGLADAVERGGARIFEQTTVDEFAPHVLRCGPRTVKAKWVVRATEGYTAALLGAARAMMPIYSLMVATEPIPQSFWDGIGLARHGDL